MAKHKQIIKKGDERLEAVEEVLSKTERLIEENQKIITIAVTLLIVIVLGYLGFKRYYVEPREQEAQRQIFMAEAFFESDSLNKALYGDGNHLGFLDIVDEFGRTKTGNLARYYAGISYLQLGEYENAIDQLKRFSGKDKIISVLAIGAMADAYMELNEPQKAVELYLKASRTNPNELTTPLMLFKAGRSYELMGNYTKATEQYEKIKREYPNTNEGRSIDKFLERSKLRSQK
ncbi:MAG: tetratricopeptide repeat protein [Bacteroidales bacterium]|nr:tetratricopeptide repeat protein [Bacteroidales bacterium]